MPDGALRQRTSASSPHVRVRGVLVLLLLLLSTTVDRLTCRCTAVVLRLLLPASCITCACLFWLTFIMLVLPCFSIVVMVLPCFFIVALGRWGVSALQTAEDEIEQDVRVARRLYDSHQH